LGEIAKETKDKRDSEREISSFFSGATMDEGGVSDIIGFYIRVLILCFTFFFRLSCD
jgi:hypothetical protein